MVRSDLPIIISFRSLLTPFLELQSQTTRLFGTIRLFFTQTVYFFKSLHRNFSLYFTSIRK
jgi:hypothetical protein